MMVVEKKKSGGGLKSFMSKVKSKVNDMKANYDERHHKEATAIA